MFTTFYGSTFFGGGFFGGNVVGGKGDNPAARTYKPTGLVDRPKLKTKAQKQVEARLAETAEIHAEVVAEAKQEFLEPVVTMSLTEIDAEIGRLLHKVIRTDDEEALLLMMMAAAAC